MLLLADLIALLHAAYVVFIGAGVLAILLGCWRGWVWTRAFWFRFTHLMLCLLVLLFEAANQPCPLTTFEQWLRRLGGVEAYQGGFIAHYVSRTIHLEVPPWVLSGPMFLLAALVLLLYWKAGPRPAPEESPAREETGLPNPPVPLGRRLCGYAGLVAFASFVLPLADWNLDQISPWWRSTTVASPTAFLAVGLLACLLAPRASGLQLGATSRWRRRDLWIAGFWVVPPLSVILIYAHFTGKPYHHSISWAYWLLGSAAQELVFFGFVYARLVKRWGEGPDGWRGALSWPVLLSALAFSLWHWPNLLAEFSASYIVFQAVYTFLGAVWCLQMRRWTGSLVPGITNHIVVNYLASVV